MAATMLETPDDIAADMVTHLRISRSLLDRIEEESRAAHPHECCGLLLGEGDEVRDILPARNVAAEPARRFEIDPVALIAAHRAARADGPAVIGHYHSHPTGLAEPSACDAQMAVADGAWWLILGNGQAMAWRAGEQGLHGRFIAAALVVEE